VEQINYLWPTAVYEDNINNNEIIEKAFNRILVDFNINDYPDNHSGNDVTDIEYMRDEFIPIVDFINYSVDNYLKKVWNYEDGRKTRIHLARHDKIKLHNHSGAQVSGVFYLSVPRGDLYLYDPRQNANRGFVKQIFEKEFKSEVRNMKAGDIILFPSFLWHESDYEYKSVDNSLPRLIFPFDTYLEEK